LLIEDLFFFLIFFETISIIMSSASDRLNQAEVGGQMPHVDMFSNKEIRNRFVQKVYGILSAQFLLTFALCALFMFV